jgi:predicted component of type VI protein secretion system
VAHVVVMEGELAGERFEVAGEFTIGRENADLTLPDAEASRRHALLRSVGDRLEIEDLQSLNGTWVDGQRVAEPMTLRDGGRIRIGSTTLLVELSTAEPAVTRVAAAPAAAQTELHERPPVPARGAAAATAFDRLPPFSPPTLRPRREVATRLWLPAASTFAIVIATAIALLVYFATR